MLFRVSAAPTNAPPFLVLVDLWLEKMLDGFGPNRVLLVLGPGLQDICRRLGFKDVLRSLGLERVSGGFGFENVVRILLAGTPGDSVKTETRLLPLDENDFFEVGIFSMVDVDFVTAPASRSSSSNASDDVRKVTLGAFFIGLNSTEQSKL